MALTHDKPGRDMKLKTLGTRFSALSPAALIVVGYGAILAIVLLQEQWSPTYAPPNGFLSVAMYGLLSLGLLLISLGSIVAVLNIVRWRRLAECLVALVLLAPMFLVAHTVVVRRAALDPAQQTVNAASAEQ